jgi:hypothetical protein
MGQARQSAVRVTVRWAGILLLAAALPGCMTAYKQTVGGEGVQTFTRIYLTDFNTAWQATLDALKSARLDVSNREGGFVQTKWTENTADKNLIDSFGSADAYLKAQYRFRVTVAKGFYNGNPSVKVAVQKEQLVERDVLEGWRPVDTDSIDENTLLYRIGRLIYIRMRINQLEENKTQKEIEASGLGKKKSGEAAPSAPAEEDLELKALDEDLK